MSIGEIARYARIKGLNLVGTGDFTHPIWFRELAAGLTEAEGGVYKDRTAPNDSPRFILTTEISSIYSQGGRGRRIHTLVFAPSLATVEKINRELTLRGANLLSDGRPIVGLTAKNIADLVLGVDPKCLVIPAHAWTPHFSLYGSISGFDSLEECFEGTAVEIFAIETGLSSDPAMNWRVGELATRRIVSFSDAHSPAKLAREANLFSGELSYDALFAALRSRRGMTRRAVALAADVSERHLANLEYGVGKGGGMVRMVRCEEDGHAAFLF
jgi:PHP family Zn ribbon phosphoesterase